MLVLSRRADEKIRIGDNVTITVLSSCANRVRLGITAPRGVSILRDELKPETTPGETGKNISVAGFQPPAKS